MFCGLLWSFRFLSLSDMNLFLAIILIGWSSSRSLQFNLSMFHITCLNLINKRNDELKKLWSRIFVLSSFNINILDVVRHIFPSQAAVSKRVTKLKARLNEKTKVCESWVLECLHFRCLGQNPEFGYSGLLVEAKHFWQSTDHPKKMSHWAALSLPAEMWSMTWKTKRQEEGKTKFSNKFLPLSSFKDYEQSKLEIFFFF